MTSSDPAGTHYSLNTTGQCRGRTNDVAYCIVHLPSLGAGGRGDEGSYYPPGDSNTIDTKMLATARAVDPPNMSCPCMKAPCPNPKCPCVPGSFGCPGVDPAFDLTKVTFAANFGDGMVLQRATNAAASNAQRSSVYGTATPGKQLQLTMSGPDGFTFEGQTTAADEPLRPEIHGTWKILLPAREASLHGYSLTVSCALCANATSTTLQNLSFGDVWICELLRP